MGIPASKFLLLLLPLTPQAIYLVGGSVRDLLIGIQDIKDIDLLIPSGSEDVARAFADKIGGSFFFLDEERRITRVVKSETGEVFQFDFANFEEPDLNTDLARRDFTVNAMALDLREFIKTGSLDKVIDLFGGRSDVRKKLIRTVKPEALDEDPLRLLRAVRFAASLGFTIENKTAEQIRARSDLVIKPSPERIRDEFFQILTYRHAGRHLSLMDSFGLLSRLFPELDQLKGFAPGKHHQYDIRTHSIKSAGYVDSVLDDLPKITEEHSSAVLTHLDEMLENLVPRKAALRLACLLHDLGKPETFSRDEEGGVHFYGHDILGAEKVQELCRRFRLSRDSEDMVTKLIKHHMRLFLLSAPGGPSKRALYRYCRDMGDALPESIILALSDSRATAEVMASGDFTDTEKTATAVLDYYYEKFVKTEEKPLVAGKDLLDLGLTPGPRFREILEEIRERQAEGALRDRKEALDYLKRMV